MRILILPPFALDTEGALDESSALPVCGSGVYRQSLLAALLRHGTYDKYFICSRSYVEPTELSTNKRVQYISRDRFPTFSNTDRVVFFAGQPALHFMLPWRVALNTQLSPLVGVIHSMHSHDFFLVLMRLLIAGDLRSSDALICSSTAGKTVVENGIKAIKEQLRSAWNVSIEFKPQLPVIPLGTDTQRFSAFDKKAARANLCISKDSFVVLYIGRFSTWEKADLTPTIVAFCKDILPQHPKALLILAGDDHMHHVSDTLHKIAGESGAGGSVLIMPNISEIKKLQLLSAGDVFISPADNIQETFGISIVEAMAAGLPIVASNWNGYKDLVIDGVNGYLVPTYSSALGNSSSCMIFSTPDVIASSTAIDMRAWSERLLHLAGNPTVRSHMGENGKLIACRQYDWRTVVHSYEDLWDSLYETAARKGRVSSLASSNTILPYDGVGFETLFAHYSSASLDDVQFSVSGAHEDMLKSGVIKEQLIRTDVLYSETLIQLILKLLMLRAPLSLHEITSSLNEYADWPEQSVRSHLSRMVKYNLVVVNPLSGKSRGLSDSTHVLGI